MNRSNMPGASGPQDGALVKQCLTGEQAAFRTLVERYQSRVVGFLIRMLKNRELAEDLAQEAFFQAYRKLDTCREPDRFFVWLLRISRNLALNQIRKVEPARAEMRGEEDSAGIEQISDQGPGPEQEIENQELIQALTKEVMSLPVIYREAVLLRHVEERSYQDIADVMEIPMGTVKFRLHRAYRLLREKIVRKTGVWGNLVPARAEERDETLSRPESHEVRTR